jgi:hypothetical protein
MKYKILLIFIVTISSCSLFTPEIPPYLVSKISVLNGIDENQNIASVNFTLVNKELIQITKLDLEFDIYDTENNQQPKIGTNHVESSIDTILEPSESLEYSILLDPLFYYSPENQLTVTRFCILNVYFSDGTIWSDKHKQFLIMAESISVESVDSDD